MKAKKQLLQLLSLIIAMVAFTACQDDMVPDLESGPGRLKISNDALALSERVDYKSETVNVLPISDISSVRSTAAGQNFESEGYTLVAEIQTPVINGEKTSATHIKIIGDKAYITYHINGSIYGGGFDIIDLSSSDNILVTSSAQFNDTDFNALDIDVTNGETYAYLAGANGKGAYVEKIRIDNGLIVDDTDSLQLEGFNANGIAVSKHQLYVTVGGSSNSGYYAIDIRNANKMWQINEQKNADYAKDVALVSTDLNSQLVFLSAGSGTIDASQVTSKGLGNFRNIQAEEINIKDGKNTIALDGEYIYAAMGDQGFQIYHEVFNSYLFKIPTSQMGGGLTNGVSVDDENIYIANGSGGVYIAKKPNGTSFGLTGLLNMDGSANYVASSNDYLLVANGTGGVKVLKKKQSEEELPWIFQTFRETSENEYRGGRYGGPDIPNLKDPNASQKNQIQVPVNQLDEIRNIQFSYKADQAYKVYVYLARQASDYSELLREYDVQKNAGYIDVNIDIKKDGYDYVIISAIPNSGSYGRAYLKDIAITGN